MSFGISLSVIKLWMLLISRLLLYVGCFVDSEFPMNNSFVSMWSWVAFPWVGPSESQSPTEFLQIRWFSALVAVLPMQCAGAWKVGRQSRNDSQFSWSKLIRFIFDCKTPHMSNSNVLFPILSGLFNSSSKSIYLKMSPSAPGLFKTCLGRVRCKPNIRIELDLEQENGHSPFLPGDKVTGNVLLRST